MGVGRDPMRYPLPWQIWRWSERRLILPSDMCNVWQYKGLWICVQREVIVNLFISAGKWRLFGEDTVFRFSRLCRIQHLLRGLSFSQSPHRTNVRTSWCQPTILAFCHMLAEPDIDLITFTQERDLYVAFLSQWPGTCYPQLLLLNSVVYVVTTVVSFSAASLAFLESLGMPGPWTYGLNLLFHLPVCRILELWWLCSTAEEDHPVCECAPTALAHAPVFAETFLSTLSEFQQELAKCKATGRNLQPSSLQKPAGEVGNGLGGHHWETLHAVWSSSKLFFFFTFAARTAQNTALRFWKFLLPVNGMSSKPRQVPPFSHYLHYCNESCLGASACKVLRKSGPARGASSCTMRVLFGCGRDNNLYLCTQPISHGAGSSFTARLCDYFLWTLLLNVTFRPDMIGGCCCVLKVTGDFYLNTREIELYELEGMPLNAGYSYIQALRLVDPWIMWEDVWIPSPRNVCG